MPVDISNQHQAVDEDKIKSLPPMLITIDGPAGAGKTTVSRSLAARLKYRYLDTGALYRGVAVEVDRLAVCPDDDLRITQLCRRLKMTVDAAQDEFRVVVNERDVTDLIRTPKITMLASAVSAKPAVRQFLLEVQRRIGRQKRIVAEGRDMGTVVFPDADVKFFLDAALRIRAERRFNEMPHTATQSLKAVEQDIKHRDENDSTRALAPLRPAQDAVRIDSTQMSVEAVVTVMMREIIRRGF